MEAKIRTLIDKVLKEYEKRANIQLPANFNYDFGLAKDAQMGDFATNVAFKLARCVKSKPNLIADELVLLIGSEKKQAGKEEFIDRIEVAGNGFINFFLKKSSLAAILPEVRQKDKHFGESDFGKGRKVLLEFVSANPTGPLTIAHGRQAAVGDSLARILQKTGHKVLREFYLNDAGRQIKLLGQSLWVRYCEQFGMEVALPDDGYRGEYLRDLAKKLAGEKKDGLLKMEELKAVAFCQDYAKNAMMDTIADDLKEIRVVFDNYFSESTLYKKETVSETLENLKKKNHLYEKEGALWFRSTDFGDDKDRVVKKSTGEYTYLAPDIAYHRSKFERGYQWLINLWGPDHHGYIVRLKAACQALGHPGEDVEIRIVQLTTLYRKGEPVRMSTRAGEFVTLKELMDEVGVDATRFFFIMRKVESPLDFDLDLAKQKSDENPVFYLQYAHARISSILKFADQPVTADARLDLLSTPEEIELIKMIAEFPKALVQASQMLEPYRLADYLRDLATGFHKFYAMHRVVTEDRELTQTRLLLVDGVRITLRNGLECLGISQPESM